MHSFLCLLAQESEIQKRAKAVCKTKKTKKNNDARPRHFHLLTTFGNVFWGGRSQHSPNMFELLTQKSSVAETIKKPTPRRVHAYWVPTGEGRLTTFGDVFWGGRSQHSSNMFELLTQKSAVVATIKKPNSLY